MAAGQATRAARARRPAQRAERACRGCRGACRRRRPADDRRRARGACGPWRAGCSSSRAARRLADRRLLQRQSRARCAPAIDVLCAACRASTGWCSATWRSSAAQPLRATRASANTRAAQASRACSRWATPRGMRSTAFGAARNWFADAKRSRDALAASARHRCDGAGQGLAHQPDGTGRRRLLQPLAAAGNGN